MSGRLTLGLYLAAAAGYLTIGVFFPDFLFSWLTAAVFLLVAVWALPALVRRLLR